MGTTPATSAQTETHIPFSSLHRDSARKYDKMRPKIIFRGKVYFFVVCLHYSIGQREAEKDLPQMAGLGKHKSNVNRWKYTCLVSLNFFFKKHFFPFS
jgi:hypothetical protein